jgi:hypothetical protein
MDTANPLGQRPFAAMGGMEGTWNLAEQNRSWIVRDTASAPIERMRVPPELLDGMGATIPGAVALYRPGPAPLLLDGLDFAFSPSARAVPFEPYPIPAPVKVAPPLHSTVTSLLTPGGTTPPVVPTVQHQEPTFGQIVPGGSPIVAIGPGSSTQNLIPSSTVVEQAAPSLTSIIAGGQPAASAVSTDASWFTDPAQEVIAGVPNWGILAGAAVLAMMMSSKGKR